jgi:hypothetical protein
VQDDDGFEDQGDLVIQEEEEKEDEAGESGTPKPPTSLKPPPSAKPSLLPSVGPSRRNSQRPGPLVDVSPPPMPAVPTSLSRSQEEVEALAEEAKKAALQSNKARRIVKSNFRELKTSVLESMNLANYYEVSILFYLLDLSEFWLLFLHNTT